MGSWIAAIVTALAVPIGSFLAIRLGRKGDRENLLIDQLQEERTANRERIEKLEAGQDELRAIVASLLSRDNLWRIHADSSDALIVTLGGKPLPRPAELLREARA